MANSQNPPVEISNYTEGSPTASSTRENTNYILTKNILPALETRLQRFVWSGDRKATTVERARSPIVRFSVFELMGFLEDAAIQVAARANSQYLQTIRNTRSPSAGSWTFSSDLRILGGTVSIDGATRAQRVSRDKREDILARGDSIDSTMPIYTFENGDLHVYGGLFDNPITAECDVISLPEPTILTATGVYTLGTGVFFITSGDTLVDDYHKFVYASINDTGGSPTIRGVLTDINEGSQNVRLEIDDTGFANSGTVTMTWRKPGYSSLPNVLEKAVLSLASADMFAAIGEYEAMKGAIEEFEMEMKTYGLQFFKI